MQRPPLLGEHTDKIMKGLGFSEDEINEFINKGII